MTPGLQHKQLGVRGLAGVSGGTGNRLWSCPRAVCAAHVQAASNAGRTLLMASWLEAVNH